MDLTSLPIGTVLELEIIKINENRATVRIETKRHRINSEQLLEGTEAGMVIKCTVRPCELKFLRLS